MQCTLCLLGGEQLLGSLLEELLDLARALRRRLHVVHTLVPREAGGGERALRVLARAHHGVLEAELLVGQLQHVVLVRALGAELVHLHGLGLADAVHARHGLHVVLRVPVRVEDDHGVGGREVDADAARARREDEDEGVRLRVREAVDRLLARRARDRAVEPLEAPALRIQDVGHQVEHLGVGVCTWVGV